MKTNEIAPTCHARMAQAPAARLLCEKLPGPAEVSFLTPMPQLAAFWRPARSLWEQNHRAESISAMEDLTRRASNDPALSIPTRLLMAHMRMDHGDTPGAERSLQSAMKELAHHAGVPVASCRHARSRDSKAMTVSRYGLSNRDWLILAVQALLNRDLESCLLWIHQADCRVFDSVATSVSPWRLRLVGDLHAVLACVAVQAKEVERAELFLASAYQRHRDAEALQSACRDLILAARLALHQWQTDRAETLLDAAECQLVMELTADKADGSPLMDIIHRDRMQIAGKSQSAGSRFREQRRCP